MAQQKRMMLIGAQAKMEVNKVLLLTAGQPAKPVLVQYVKPERVVEPWELRKIQKAASEEAWRRVILRYKPACEKVN